MKTQHQIKIIFSFLSALFLIMNVHAQSTVWVQQGKVPKTEYGNAIAHDNNGNIYITGTFQDSVRFDTILLKESFGDYCAKYDSSGNIIWAYKNMGGDGVVFDGSSNLYLFSNESRSLQKIDLNGTIVWNKTLFTNSIFGSNGIQDVYVKDAGVYVTGFYSSDTYFSNDTVYNAGGWDIFIAKFNSSGENQWAKTAGGNGLDKGYSLYVNNSDEVYAVGYFKDTAYFGTSQLISNGVQDMYLAKYDFNGDLLWAKNYGGTGFDLAAKIIADDNGYLYTTGRYNATITFGTITLDGINTDAFITKFDANGNPVWAKGISGQGGDEEADIVYENGKLAFIATTAGNVALDGFTMTGLGNLDICIGKMDTAGTVLWAKLFGGSSDDEGSGIALLNGGMYFNGSFKTIAHLGAFELTSMGAWDIVTGKLDNIPTGVSLLDNKVPQEFSLSQNYPNPFNPNTIIRFSLPQGNHVTLKVFDTIGKEVAVLINESLEAGEHEVNFNALNISSGLYFYSLRSGASTQTKKMILLK